MISFGVEVIADDSGEFAGNNVRFRSPGEAEAYGADLAARWTLVSEWRVCDSDKPANYEWVAGHLRTLEETAGEKA